MIGLNSGRKLNKNFADRCRNYIEKAKQDPKDSLEVIKVMWDKKNAKVGWSKDKKVDDREGG